MQLSVCFPMARLPGRGRAEYGGLSLQSARLGYSTVISVCLLRKNKKATHNTAFKPEPSQRTCNVPVCLKRRPRPWLNGEKGGEE